EKNLGYRLFAESIVIAWKIVEAERGARYLQEPHATSEPGAISQQGDEPAKRRVAHGAIARHTDHEQTPGLQDSTDLAQRSPELRIMLQDRVAENGVERSIGEHRHAIGIAGKNANSVPLMGPIEVDADTLRGTAQRWQTEQRVGAGPGADLKHMAGCALGAADAIERPKDVWMHRFNRRQPRVLGRIGPVSKMPPSRTVSWTSSTGSVEREPRMADTIFADTTRQYDGQSLNSQPLGAHVVVPICRQRQRHPSACVRRRRGRN